MTNLTKYQLQDLREEFIEFKINEILNHCEKSGLGSAQYFCEEFVFIPDGQEPEDVAKLHDPLYLDITEFNYHHWIGNKMEDY